MMPVRSEDLQTVRLQRCPSCGAEAVQLQEGGGCEACFAASMLSSGPGEAADGTIGGHRLLERLSSGGMGVVYKAREPGTDRIVALKMLHPVVLESSEARERFQIEALAMAGLDHPRILPLFRSDTDLGRPYLTMKYAAGGSLADRLRRDRHPFLPRAAAVLVRDLALALQHAHDHGVLHRDVKPGNILFDDEDTAFLGDFGIARLTGESGRLTGSGVTLGTPNYMPPEIVRKDARSATVASDVYGLGAVLYELIAGDCPFRAPTVGETFRRIREDEPAPLPVLKRSGEMRDLATITLKCLQKEPPRRYASARDLAADLDCWLQGRPVAARPLSRAARIWRWTKRNPALAGVSALLTLSLAGGIIAQFITLQKTRQREVQARTARRSADDRVRFIAGRLADIIEPLGRDDVLNESFADVAAYYASLPEGERDADSRANEASCLLRWADSLRQQEHWADASGAASHARNIAVTLRHPSAARLHAWAERILGVIASRRGEAGAADHFLRAREIARPGAQADMALAAEFAAACAESGRSAREEGDIAGGLAVLAEGRRCLSTHFSRTPPGPSVAALVRQDADCLHYEAWLHRQTASNCAAEPDKARAANERALVCYRAERGLLETLTGPDPANLVLLREQNVAASAIARTLTDLGPANQQEALTELEFCERTARKLAVHNFTNVRWQTDHAAALRDLAVAHQSAGSAGSAATAMGEALTVFSDALKREPRPETGAAISEAASLAKDMIPQLAEADAAALTGPLLEAANAFWTSLPNPDIKSAQLFESCAKAALGKITLPQATAQWRDWTTRLEKNGDRIGASPFYKYLASGLHRRMADRLAGTVDALEPSQRALSLRSTLLRDACAAGQITRSTVSALHSHLTLLSGLKRYTELKEAATAALDLIAASARCPSGESYWRQEWGTVFLTAAQLLSADEAGLSRDAASIASRAAAALAAQGPLNEKEQKCLDALHNFITRAAPAAPQP